jgi:hypothetical protein
MRFSYLLAVVLANVGQVVQEDLPVLISFIDSSSTLMLLGAVHFAGFRPLRHIRICFPGGWMREPLFYFAKMFVEESRLFVYRSCSE